MFFSPQSASPHPDCLPTLRHLVEDPFSALPVNKLRVTIHEFFTERKMLFAASPQYQFNVQDALNILHSIFWDLSPYYNNLIMSY